MNNKTIFRLTATMLLTTLTLMSSVSTACTNFLFARGTTIDGSTMITYAADSHTRYGQLRYHPATDHQPGETVRLYDYGSLQYRLTIPQPAHTYNVVGFINEFQLAIGETTFGGRSELEKGNSNGIDYGNLIYLALQRARNCREAIKVMDELMSLYGYASSGESFSICDPKEVWIMEIISKGEYEKGAVWVARRVPDSCICGHANQSRITDFPTMQAGKTSRKSMPTSISNKYMNLIDLPSVECIYSHDVVSFAIKHRFYDKGSAPFSFADTYNPLTFSGARACDARVYAMFRRMADNMEQYEAYAMGNLSAKRLPLWVKPNKKVSAYDVMNLMRDHFEGTPMTMSNDVGAGPFHLPYRWRPMDFTVDGHTYIHERATSTQQTGFSFVAQCRSWLPNKVGGVLWFGVDDTYSTVYCPMRCGVTQIPECLREGNGSMTEYSSTSAFWLFNRVSNFCYLRYDSMIVDVQAAQRELEQQYIADLDHQDQALNHIADSPRLTGELNRMATQAADVMMKRWHELDEFLLVKYIDGNIKYHTGSTFDTTATGRCRTPRWMPYPDWYLRQIVNDHGDIIQAR